MSSAEVETRTVTLSVSSSEANSIAQIASLISNEILQFATKHGVAGQYHKDEMESDLIIFFAKRQTVGLQELRVSITDEGAEIGNTITGRRLADLRFRVNYTSGVYGK